MRGDKSTIGSPDRDRIHVNQACELQCRTQAPSVSADEPRAAMQKVGPVAASLRVHLGE